MKKILQICLFAITLLLVASCKKETVDELVGTVWKAEADLNSIVPPSGSADAKLFYVLRFYTQGRYSLAIEDSKGNLIENRWQGIFQREEKEDKKIDIVVYVNNRKEIFDYHPKERHMYSNYHEVKFIKQ